MPTTENLTEEMPETPKDLTNRGLLLDSGQVIGSKKLLTEELPQEEEEDEAVGPGLLLED